MRTYTDILKSEIENLKKAFKDRLLKEMTK